MKQTIRLKEIELKRIISESVKRIVNENRLNEGVDAFENLSPDLYYLLCKLLAQFVQGRINIPEKDNEELIKDAKALLFNLG